MSTPNHDPIAFAERALGLLGQGHFVATYKYAVLLGLIDSSIETMDAAGRVPSRVPTELLAEKVVELYWPHVVPFSSGGPDSRAIVLEQNIKGQAAIVTKVKEFRDKHNYATLAEARAQAPWRRLLRSIEWKLAEMPLPRLQTIGKDSDPFIYEIGWSHEIRHSEFFADGFDRSLRLKPQVGRSFVRLSPLLRPAIQREWAAWIARQQANQGAIKDAFLEAHLFGQSRKALKKVRPGLKALQGGRCFYGDHSLGESPEVDHFIPWSRYPDDSIHNLVAACQPCNNDRRNTLASRSHLERWALRLADGSDSRLYLDELVTELPWYGDADRARSVARSVYSSLPQTAAVWEANGEVGTAGRNLIDCLR